MVLLMADLQHPFLDDHDTHPSVVHSKLLNSSIRNEGIEMSEDMYDLIQQVRLPWSLHYKTTNLCIQCLERNPALRPSIEDIKVHSYFSDTYVKIFLRDVIPTTTIYFAATGQV